MGFFPTSPGDGDEIGPNTHGTYFKYNATDDRWYIIANIEISNVDYNEGTWDANLDGATKNVIRDELETHYDSPTDINHITDAQLAALHATYTDSDAVQAVEDTGLILSASKTINIDGTPADATYTGICLDINTDGCATYDAVYIDGINSCLPAKADAIGTMPCIGIVVAANKVLVLGVLRIDATFVLAADKVVYVDEDNAGDIKDAVPGSVGDIVQVIGYTVGTDMLYVNPALVWAVRK